MKIGLDLDNTLICYDDAFQRVGREEGLLPLSFSGNKVLVKQSLLDARPDGFLWESLQGLVYGRRIDAARLFDSVPAFLAECRDRGHEVVIVSHKTEQAHHDPLRTDLREAALRFMENQRFFDVEGLRLSRDGVHFEGTREGKVKRIAELGCDVFIDDLVEVLAHGDMPTGCRKILFGENPDHDFEQYTSWDDVRAALFRHS